MSISADFVNQVFADMDRARLVGRPELVIWGGRFPESQADAFLDAWNEALRTTLTWRMVEYVSRFALYQVNSQDAARPDPWFNVERARFFGEMGDLDLRRDGQEFRWRFIGDVSDQWPVLTDAFQPQDFWSAPENRQRQFREVQQKYYQWQGHRREQRVSSRDWLKEAGLNGENVYLEQKQYLDQGRVAFVRYIGFPG